MITADKSPTAVFFDVDGTLIKYTTYHDPGCNDELYNKATERPVYFYPHDDNIRELKRCSHLGHTVIIWSHGGTEWAQKVIEHLGLVRYVDFIIPKVEIYVDDCPIEQWQFINKFHHAPFGQTVKKST